MRQVAGSLRLDLAQYRELAAFAQFGSDLDVATQKQLTRGERMVEILKQDQYVPMKLSHQVMIIWTGVNGYLDDIPVDRLKDFEKEFFEFCAEKFPDVEVTIDKEKIISDAVTDKLKQATEQFKEQFKART